MVYLLLLSPVIFVVSWRTIWVANREKYQIVLIHSTRDTLKRSVSHYLHQKSKGRCVNLADCIEKFPEIITESDYGTFKRRWLASDCKFLEIDVVSPTAITTLQETGLNIHRIGTSNVRYRPMFPRIMGFLVWLREGWMGKILMRILPERILRAVKKKRFWWVVIPCLRIVAKK